MKVFLKTIFIIDEPMGRLEFFFLSLILSVFQMVFLFAGYNFYNYLNTLKEQVSILFVFGTIVLLIFVILWIIALLVTNFVCITKRCWDITSEKIISSIIAGILIISNLFLRNSIFLLIFYLALCLLPGQIIKKHKDVSVLDVLEKDKEQNFEEG